MKEIEVIFNWHPNGQLDKISIEGDVLKHLKIFLEDLASSGIYSNIRKR